MLKRLIYAAVGVLGLVLIGLGIASATAWRADDVLVADATASGAILVTDPGVLEMAGNPVTVRATVPKGGDVVLVVGRDTDVAGWVGSDDHQRVTGLSGWHTLALGAPGDTLGPTPTGGPTPTDTASATSSPAPTSTPPGTTGASATGGSSEQVVPNPAGSDMWVAQAHGSGTATLTWTAREGRWSLLVVGMDPTGGPATPTLSLAWPRVVTTPWLLPGVLLGSLLVLACLGLFGRDWLRTRRRPELAEWTPVLTGAIPMVGADGEPSAVPTRRQLREAQARAAGRPPTGSIPAVRAATGATPAVTAPTPQTAFVPISDDASPAVPAPVATSGLHGATLGQMQGGGAAGIDVVAPSAAAQPPPGSRRARRAGATLDQPAAVAGPGRPTPGLPAPGLPAPGLPAPGLPAPGPLVGSATGDPAAPIEPAAGAGGAHEGRPRWARPERGEPALTPPARPASAHPTVVHPSWLPAGVSPALPADAAAVPPPPAGTAPTPAPRFPHAEGSDVARADAWRRAWGLPPTEGEAVPSSDDDGGQEPRPGAGTERDR